MKDERGASAVELLVASGLLLGLLLLALPPLLTAHRVAVRGVREAGVHDEGRVALVEAARRLRSARPPGVCLDPVGAPLDACLHVAARQATLLQATAQRLCFADAPNALDGGTEVAAPRLVCIGRAAGEAAVLVTTWEPAAVDDCASSPPAPVSYLTPCWEYDAPARRQLVGMPLDATTPLFRYADDAGALVTPPGPQVLDRTTDDLALAPACPAGGSCLAADLARVAIVRFDLRLGYRLGRQERIVNVHMTVAPRGATYAREQTWSVG